MRVSTTSAGKVVLVRFDPDEDLLVGLRGAVEASGLRDAAVVGGVGSLRRFRAHVVGKPELPTVDRFFQGEGPYDILAVTGLVIAGRVHAHITVANTERTLGGHLEEGCRVLTFAVVTLLELPEAEIAGWDGVGPLR